MKISANRSGIMRKLERIRKISNIKSSINILEVNSYKYLGIKLD